MSEENDNKREIKVVTGDGTDLDISPVYDHIKIDSSNNREKKKDIIIPKSKKDVDKKSSN